MKGNIICILFIVLYGAFCVYLLVHSIIKSKKDKIPQGCFSCAAYKKGVCKSHSNCGGSSGAVK